MRTLVGLWHMNVEFPSHTHLLFQYFHNFGHMEFTFNHVNNDMSQYFLNAKLMQKFKNRTHIESIL